MAAAPLVRAGMQDRLVVAVAIDEIDGAIGLRRKAQIAHQRPAGKLALDPHGIGAGVVRRVQNRAGADIGDDLLRRDLDPDGDRVGAIALAENVLRIISAEWEIVRYCCADTGRHDKRNTGQNPLNDRHTTTPKTSTKPKAPPARGTLAKVARPANRYVQLSGRSSGGTRRR